MRTLNAVVSVFDHCPHEGKLAYQHSRDGRGHIAAKLSFHVQKYCPEPEKSDSEEGEEEREADHECIVTVDGILIFLVEMLEVLAADIEVGSEVGLVGTDKVVFMKNF